MAVSLSGWTEFDGRGCLLIPSYFPWVQCTCKAFELETFPEKKLLVPCAMTLNVLKVGHATCGFEI